MFKRTKTLLIIILIVVILALIFFGAREEPYLVKDDPLAENRMLEQNLEYSTQFCAQKLNLLLEEIHFIESEITSEEDILVDKTIEQQEEKVIAIEKRELQEVKDEFNEYKEKCDEFEISRDLETCTQFLEESKRIVDTFQEQVDQKGFFEGMDIRFKDLRIAKNSYAEMKRICAVLG